MPDIPAPWAWYRAEEAVVDGGVVQSTPDRAGGIGELTYPDPAWGDDKYELVESAYLDGAWALRGTADPDHLQANFGPVVSVGFTHVLIFAPNETEPPNEFWESEMRSHLWDDENMSFWASTTNMYPNFQEGSGQGYVSSEESVESASAWVFRTGEDASELWRDGVLVASGNGGDTELETSFIDTAGVGLDVAEHILFDWDVDPSEDLIDFGSEVQTIHCYLKGRYPSLGIEADCEPPVEMQPWMGPGLLRLNQRDDKSVSYPFLRIKKREDGDA